MLSELVVRCFVGGEVEEEEEDSIWVLFDLNSNELELKRLLVGVPIEFYKKNNLEKKLKITVCYNSKN
jgi:hypothetical protein